jgi:hypothetical protein
VICVETENTKSDVKLNKMLKSAKWQSVKELIVLEVNLLTAKIESLKELVHNQVHN